MGVTGTAEQPPQTLAQRMAQCAISTGEALRYAVRLAEALRVIHEGGRVHGALSPQCLLITRDGLELLSPPGGGGSITPYAAPEVIAGDPPTPQSDIFSFGAIFYEVLTGHRAFPGELTEAPPCGNPALDRLLAGCLAADPAERCQYVQKLIPELKLLSIAVRRAEQSGPDRREAAESTLCAQMQQLERSLMASLARFEKSVDSVGARIAGIEQILTCTGNRVERLEQGLEGLRREAANWRVTASEDFALFERALRHQAMALESTRSASEQTDQLVGRVVDALESLHTAKPGSGGHTPAAA